MMEIEKKEDVYLVLIENNDVENTKMENKMLDENKTNVKEESSGENDFIKIEKESMSEEDSDSINCDFLEDTVNMADTILNLEEDSDDSTENRKRRVKENPVSFVQELLKNNPELKRNNELLIQTLTDIMRLIKPPELPPNCYKACGDKFRCSLCNVMTISEPAAGRHYHERHGPRYLKCFACGADFRSKANLYKHEMRCGLPDAKVVLKARGMFLGRKGGRNRPFQQDIDRPKPISQRRPARTHNPGEIQVPRKRLRCDLCPASFLSKPALVAHLHLHRGERPYLCTHCTAAYVSPSALSRHLKRHTGVQYICDHCDKSFVEKSSIVTHMDTHLPMKKFKCDECEKRYAQRAALVLHVNRVHRRLPAPFACAICDKRYPRMSVLKLHMMRVHKLSIMTRKMFFKALPTMTEDELKQQKLLFESSMQLTDKNKEGQNVDELLLNYLNSLKAKSKDGPAISSKRKTKTSDKK